MAQWEALTQQPNRALELYRDKSFPLDVSNARTNMRIMRKNLRISACFTCFSAPLKQRTC